MISFLADVDTVRVSEDELRQFDPELRTFFNVNTPDDLAEARRIAGG
jgi:molybdopterin-guanine dinucleotide biosynthesis protein A